MDDSDLPWNQDNGFLASSDATPGHSVGTATPSPRSRHASASLASTTLRTPAMQSVGAGAAATHASASLSPPPLVALGTTLYTNTVSHTAKRRGGSSDSGVQTGEEAAEGHTVNSSQQRNSAQRTKGTPRQRRSGSAREKREDELSNNIDDEDEPSAGTQKRTEQAEDENLRSEGSLAQAQAHLVYPVPMPAAAPPSPPHPSPSQKWSRSSPPPIAEVAQQRNQQASAAGATERLRVSVPPMLGPLDDDEDEEEEEGGGGFDIHGVHHDHGSYDATSSNNKEDNRTSGDNSVEEEEKEEEEVHSLMSASRSPSKTTREATMSNTTTATAATRAALEVEAAALIKELARRPPCRHGTGEPRFRNVAGYFCNYCTYTVCDACFALVPRSLLKLDEEAAAKATEEGSRRHSTRHDAAPENAETRRKIDTNTTQSGGLETGVAEAVTISSPSLGSPVQRRSTLEALTAALATPATATSLTVDGGGGARRSTSEVVTRNGSGGGQGTARVPRCHFCRSGNMIHEEALLCEWTCEGPMPELRLQRKASIAYDTVVLQRYHYAREQRLLRAQCRRRLTAEFHDSVACAYFEESEKPVKDRVLTLAPSPSSGEGGEEATTARRTSRRPPCCEEGGSFIFSVQNPRLEESCVWCAVNTQLREAHPVYKGHQTVTPLMLWCCPPTLPGLAPRRYRVQVPYGVYALNNVHALALYMTSDIFRKASTQLTAASVMPGGGGSGGLAATKVAPSGVEPLLLVRVLHHVASTPSPIAPLLSTNPVYTPLGQNSSRSSAGGGGAQSRVMKASSQPGAFSSSRPRQQPRLERAPVQWPDGLASSELAACIDHVQHGRSVAVFGLASKQFFIEHVAYSAELKHYGIMTVDASYGGSGEVDGGAVDPQGGGGQHRRQHPASVLRQLREVRRVLADAAAQRSKVQKQQLQKDFMHVEHSRSVAVPRDATTATLKHQQLQSASGESRGMQGALASSSPFKRTASGAGAAVAVNVVDVDSSASEEERSQSPLFPTHTSPSRQHHHQQQQPGSSRRSRSHSYRTPLRHHQRQQQEGAGGEGPQAAAVSSIPLVLSGGGKQTDKSPLPREVSLRSGRSKTPPLPLAPQAAEEATKNKDGSSWRPPRSSVCSMPFGRGNRGSSLEVYARELGANIARSLSKHTETGQDPMEVLRHSRARCSSRRLVGSKRIREEEEEEAQRAQEESPPPLLPFGVARLSVQPEPRSSEGSGGDDEMISIDEEEDYSGSEREGGRRTRRRRATGLQPLSLSRFGRWLPPPSMLASHGTAGKQLLLSRGEEGPGNTGPANYEYIPCVKHIIAAASSSGVGEVAYRGSGSSMFYGVAPPTVVFEDEAVRNKVVRACRVASKQDRCVRWQVLPSSTACRVMPDAVNRGSRRARQEQPQQQPLLSQVNSLRTGWVPPVILVVHGIDLMDAESSSLLLRLCAEYGNTTSSGSSAAATSASSSPPSPINTSRLLQLLASFDDPQWPLSPLAASLSRQHLALIELRSLLLPRVHEMRHMNTLALLTSFEAAAAGLDRGAAGMGSLPHQDTIRRTLFSLPANFAAILHMMIQTQEEMGAGHYIPLLTFRDHIEKSGQMLNPHRLKSILRELTSNRLALYRSGENTLLIPQHRTLLKVLTEVTEQRQGAEEVGSVGGHRGIVDTTVRL